MSPFFETGTNATVTATVAGHSHGDIVARREKSDFQILAYFAKAEPAGVTADIGGWAAELAAKGVGEVAVTGKAEVEGKPSEIVRAIGQPFERSAEAQSGQVAMDWYAGSLLKKAGEMKGRRVHRAGHLIERDGFTEPARQVSFDRLRAVCVIGFSAVSAALAWKAMPRERGSKHVGDELKRRYIGPERFESIGFGSLQPLHKFAVPPENACIAGASDEGKRPSWAVVDGGIEFADNIVEDARRGDEDGAAIAAVGRMADAIGRFLREEGSLIDVGGHASPAEVLGERAVAHENDVVDAAVFLGRGSAATGAAG